MQTVPQIGRNRWITLGRVLLFFLISAFVLVLPASFFPRLPSLASQFVLGCTTAAATLVATWLFVRWDRLSLRDVGAAPNLQSLPRAFTGFALGLLLVALQTLFVQLAGHVHWVRSPSVGFAPGLIALLAYLALASREELAFRGYPLRRLDSCFGATTAQLLVAFVFAIEHVAGGATWANAFLGAFVGSLLFGMAALVTRGLALPVGLHAAWNFGQWTIGEKEIAGFWRPIVDQGWAKHVDRIGMLSYLFVFASSIVALSLFARLRRRSESTPTT